MNSNHTWNSIIHSPYIIPITTMLLIPLSRTKFISREKVGTKFGIFQSLSYKITKGLTPDCFWKSEEMTNKFARKFTLFTRRWWKLISPSILFLLLIFLHRKVVFDYSSDIKVFHLLITCQFYDSWYLLYYG